MGMDLKSVAMVLPIPTTSLCSALSFSEVGKAYQTIKIWILDLLMHTFLLLFYLFFIGLMMRIIFSTASVFLSFEWSWIRIRIPIGFLFLK